jgi:polyisoprenoid-binding protein YceI
MPRTLPCALLVLLSCAPAAAQVQSLHADPSGTSITYFIVHPLHHVEATSKSIESTATIDASAHTVTGVEMTVDVTTFDSGNSNRDSHAMEVVDALTYPEAKFVGERFESKGDSLMVSGNLTFHGVTRAVTLRTLPTWSTGSLEVSGTLDVSLTEFSVERPSLLLIPVEDGLHFVLRALFRW